MCGRFTFASAPEVVAEFFGLAALPEVEARYNIARTQAVAVIVDGDAGRQIDRFRWGLIPSWAKDPGIGNNKMINARAETVVEKPAFRSAFKQRRCLVPADGFYEWQKGPKVKQPFCIRMKDESPFALAGIWERWEGAGQSVLSFSILTTTPNEVLQPIHDRMPVILRRADFVLWLDRKLTAVDRLTPLLIPYAAAEMTAFRVSTRVNSPSRDDASCAEPVPP